MEQIQIHTRVEPGQFSHVLGARGLHAPVLSSCRYWISRAGVLGEPCGQWAQGAFDLRGAESLRSIMGLCGLIKNHSANAINTACSTALKAGTYRFKDLRRLLGQPTAVRQQMACGLFHALIDAREENDLQRRDAFLVEMRQLQQAWPQDPTVREPLANGLFSALIRAKEENNLQRRDALLVELRQLQQDWPQDAPVRERLATGLFNVLIDAKDENNLQRRDALLVELSQLQQAWPQDASVRELLVKASMICQ
jgi:hypothetical protein